MRMSEKTGGEYHNIDLQERQTTAMRRGTLLSA